MEFSLRHRNGRSKDVITVVIKDRQLDRECIAGMVILICILVIILSVVSLRFLDVKVSNIELVDRGLFTVITDRGPVNISHDDVLRIERSYTKVAITGTPVEMVRISTVKGFIFMSSLDKYYKTGQQLMNSVDYEGKPVWIRSSKSEATESEQSWNQLLNSNYKSVQQYSYAIGTPSKLASVVFFVLSLQYLALAIAGVALIIFIFPLRLVTTTPTQPFIQEDQEYSASEEVIGAVAK